MRWVRSTFFARLIAAVLVASMLPAFMAPIVPASAQSPMGTYERWIRAQLRVPANADLEAAFEDAAKVDSRSFQDFVAVFLDAYESRHPALPAARAFTTRDLSHEALLSFLQRRYTEIGGDAVLPRIRLAAATTAPGTNTASSAVVVEASPAPAICHLDTAVPFGGADLVIPFRTLSSARSQGP